MCLKDTLYKYSIKKLENYVTVLLIITVMLSCQRINPVCLQKSTLTTVATRMKAKKKECFFFVTLSVLRHI